MDYGWPSKLALRKQTKKKISTVQLGCEHDNRMNKKRRQPSTGQKKKDQHVDRFNLFLLRKINAVHEFLSMINTVYGSVRCMVVIVHKIVKACLKAPLLVLHFSTVN